MVCKPDVNISWRPAEVSRNRFSLVLLNSPMSSATVTPTRADVSHTGARLTGRHNQCSRGLLFSQVLEEHSIGIFHKSNTNHHLNVGRTRATKFSNNGSGEVSGKSRSGHLYIKNSKVYRASERHQT